MKSFKLHEQNMIDGEDRKNVEGKTKSPKTVTKIEIQYVFMNCKNLWRMRYRFWRNYKKLKVIDQSSWRALNIIYLTSVTNWNSEVRIHRTDCTPRERLSIYSIFCCSFWLTYHYWKWRWTHDDLHEFELYHWEPIRLMISYVNVVSFFSRKYCYVYK